MIRKIENQKIQANKIRPGMILSIYSGTERYPCFTCCKEGGARQRFNTTYLVKYTRKGVAGVMQRMVTVNPKFNTCFGDIPKIIAVANGVHIDEITIIALVITEMPE